MDWLFADNAYLFSVPAILGSAYFLLNLLMGELGGDADGDVDLGDGGGDSPAAEFRVLSLQTISAFAMGSGWMGLASLRVMDTSFTVSTLIAIGSGLVVAWVLLSLLRALWTLQSSGNIPLDAALGKTGTVYIAVPPKGEGSGRVTIVVNKRRREYSAVQHGGVAIESKTRVGIVGVDHASNTVSVEEI
jgi:hypothetical protein